MKKTKLSLLSLVGITATSTLIAQDNAPRRPNILLIVADDHGQNDLGCYGNMAIKTPNLDYLASQGTRFTRAYSPTSSSSPSRATILTGYYNHANGMYGLNHRTHHQSAFENFTSLPLLLAEADYETAICGKFYVSPTENFNFKHWLKGKGHNPAEMAKYSAEFIKSNGDNPFFLYFATEDPHRTGDVVDSIPEKPNCFGNCYGFPESPDIVYSTDEVIIPPYLTDTKETRAELAQYYQSVSRMDYGIGKLFEALKESGKWENTLIIYTSDNGVAMPGAKTTLYEAGINMPFIVKKPGDKDKAAVSDALIGFVDITPTILDFTASLDIARNTLDSLSHAPTAWYNMKMQPDFQGRSFKALLDGKSNERWDTIYASHNFHEITMYYPMRVICTRKFKLIWNIAHELEYPFASDLYESSTWQGMLHRNVEYLGQKKVNDFLFRPEFELYDLENDPDESKNLAALPQYKETLEGLKRKLREWQKKTRDPWVLKWDRE